MSDNIRKKDFINTDECDKNLLLELIDNAMDESNNELKIVDTLKKESKEFDNTENAEIMAYNDGLLNKIVRINPNYWVFIDGSRESMFQLFLKSLFGNRNIYSINTQRGYYKNIYSTNYSNDTSKVNCTKYIFNPLSFNYPSFINNIKLTSIIPPGVLEKDTKYMTEYFNYSRKLDYINAVEHKYRSKNKKKHHCKYIKDCIDNRYHIVKIPKELMMMFSKITKFWKEIKDQLVLNPKTGYYYYIVKTEGEKDEPVPIICKHQAMILDGVSNDDIATECYTNGVCKYCGQDIIAYGDSSGLTLSPAASTLIIQFSEIFNKSYSTENIIYIVTEYITKKLLKEEISLYSTDECVGITCLVLSKLCLLVKENFDVIDYKIKALLSKLSKHLAQLGKSDSEIKEILDSHPIFNDINNVINRLKSAGVTSNETKVLTNSLEDILFNGTGRNPKTTVQKLYLEDKEKIYALHLALRTVVNMFYNKKIKIDIDKNKSSIHYENIKAAINSQGFSFFNKACKYYCPVNYFHEFSNNVCKHCGLHKDTKNVEEVYNKYSNTINNTAIEEPIILNESMLTKLDKIKNAIDNTIDGIKRTSTNEWKDILKRYLSYTDIVKLEEKLDKVVNISNLSILVNVPLDTLNKEFKSSEDIKKIIIYIIQSNIRSEEAMINDIISSMYERPDPRVYIKE